MELPISTQAGELLAALLTGTGLGLVYDLLRPLRRGPRTTVLTDLLFSLLTLVTLLAFLLYAGRGRLRIFALAGMAAGAAAWFLTLSRPFRLLNGAFWRLMTWPIRRLFVFAKKISKNLKKQ